MASEQPSEFTLEREKLDLDVPQVSALATQLMRLQAAFAPRRGGMTVKVEGEDVEVEAETVDDFEHRIDIQMKKLTWHKNHAKGKRAQHFGVKGVHPISGKPTRAFEYFNLANDEQLETATNNMVLDYEKYHPKTPNPRLQAQWETQRGQDVGRYREVLDQMLEAENQRLDAFSGEHYNAPDERVRKTTTVPGVPTG